MYMNLPICHLDITYLPIFVNTYHLITSHLVIVKSYAVWNEQECTLLCEPEAFFEVIDLSNRRAYLVKGRSQHSWGFVSQTCELFLHIVISQASQQTNTLSNFGET